MGKGIRLDIAIVERKLCGSRTEAQELIKNGVVFVDGDCVTKVTKQITEAQIIDVRGKRQFVSRGGEKLSGLLQDIYVTEDVIKKNIEGKVALDVGSSTGGFTDCLLKYGATHIDAVDVGTFQLHESLRKDPRITLYENQDIRTFIPKQAYDIIVVDVSFISILDIFEVLISFGTSARTAYYILIKPQFEVGKGNTKKGIVKDVTLVDKVLMNIQIKAKEYGLQQIQVHPSRIQGSDGNQEYFLYAVQ